MKAFLAEVLLDTAGDVDTFDVVDYLATKLVASGIVDPADLGFLCSGQSGVPVSVQLALDPNMPASAVQLLRLACSRQMALKQGVLDLAALRLSRLSTARVSPSEAKPTASEPAVAVVPHEALRQAYVPAPFSNSAVKLVLPGAGSTSSLTPKPTTTLVAQGRARMKKAI